MQILTGDMWSDGKKIMLSDLLKKIPFNQWDWYMYEIDATGIAPHGFTMSDFEDFVSSKDEGVKFSWHEIKTFSDSLNDIHHCFLAALSSPKNYDSLIKGDYSSCQALIQIFDSTEWELRIFD
ncbi:hypothetical protein FNI64_23370 [Salmonella enterica subsp. salamae]|nr:hypothetical protein [Salmonella enterica subsp. salamae]